jgi:hypothetical protein
VRNLREHARNPHDEITVSCSVSCPKPSGIIPSIRRSPSFGATATRRENKPKELLSDEAAKRKHPVPLHWQLLPQPFCIRCRYYEAVLPMALPTVVNVALAFVPRAVMAVMHTR